VYTLGEVVVTGKRDGVESIGTVYRVTQEEISISGARNLNEAIELLPGVNVMVGGDAVPRIDIRGFRSRHNVLLLNGIPINSTYDQQFNPSIIPVDFIAEIKMTTGPSSVLYGQGGLGGVINIITQKGTEGLKAMVGAEAGAGSSHRESANLSGKKGKVNFFSSASYSRRDAYPLSDDFEDTDLEGGKYRDNSDKKAGSLFANIGYDPTDNLSLGLTATYLFGEYGVPATAYDFANDPFAPKKKFRRIEDYNGFSVQAAFDYFPKTSGFNMRGWVFHNQMGEQNNRYSDNTYNSFTTNPYLITYELTSDTQVTGITLQPQYDFGTKGALTVGFSAQLDAWQSRGTAWNDWSAQWPPQYLPVEVDDNKTISLYSAKAEYEWPVLSNLGLTVGYAYHYQIRHDHDEYVDPEKPNKRLSLNEDTDGDYVFLIGSYYDITKRTRLKAAFQRNIRFPSIRQLYDVDAGNPELTTEQVYHYSAGVEVNWPRKIRTTLDGFYSIANNFIEKDNRDSGNFENFDEYLFAGAELAAEIRTVDNLFVRLGYSYLETEDNTGSGKDDLQYRPRHRVTLESKYTFSWGFTPYVSFVYVADQYFYGKGGNPYDPPPKATLDNYAVINVKLNYTIKDKFTIYAGADNILDENYYQSYGYPLSGRYIYGGAQWRF
jgi:vitamin B12 transporter